MGKMASLAPSTSPEPSPGFFTHLYVSLILTVFFVILALSIGALIFPGDLAAHAPRGVAVALLTAIIGTSLVAWRSSYAGTVSIPHDRTAPILAILSAEILNLLGTSAEPGLRVSVILASVAVTSIVTGTALYLFGRFQLGNLARFIPYPVVGGFLAGSGWLLATGSLRVMTGVRIGIHDLHRLIEPGIVEKWIPGVLFGSALYILNRRYRRPLLLPGMIAAALLLFYAILLIGQTPIATARLHGWLPSLPEPGGFRIEPWSPLALGALGTSGLLSLVSVIGTIFLTALISILLNSSGLELTVNAEVDINRELRAAGLSNIVCGTGGGVVGFQSLNLSRMAYELGSRNRVPALLTAGFAFLILLVGPTPTAYLPLWVLGGLLFHTSLGFLVEWTYDAWFKLPRADYFVVLLILTIVSTLGYVQGVASGILAAAILFIHTYSRIGAVTQRLTGAEQQSAVERPLLHQRLLREHGGSIHILKLHGFIFFGTATGLLSEIRDRARDPGRPPLRFVVLDFRNVSGIDSSATLSLTRIQQLALKQGFVVAFANIPERARKHLARAGLGGSHGKAYHVFPDLDHALEFTENELLEHVQADRNVGSSHLRDQLTAVWHEPESVERFLKHLERQSLATGEYLIRQGEPADALFFVESGEITTQLDLPDGRAQRLRRHGAGTVLGELGLFLGVPRTASAVTNQPCVIYRLSNTALARLKTEDPATSAQFHEFLVRYLSERIVDCNKTIRALAQ